MMNMILAVGRSMKWMMKIYLCLMPLNKILEINYAYISLTQPMAKNILWRVNIFFTSQRMDDIGGLFRAKGRLPEGKMSCKGNKGVYFSESYNRWGDMVS